jgi:CheY-like chemotaxis protein
MLSAWPGKAKGGEMTVALSPLRNAFLRASPTQAPSRAAKVEPVRLPKRLRVLLVEDDDADVYLIRRALSEISNVVEVRTARDGVQALELIDNWPAGPDLAIVDLKMPRKDGFALLREFATRKGQTFPAVVLTSSKSGADFYRAKKRGAAEFLTKPNGLEKLKNALSDAIDKL